MTIPSSGQISFPNIANVVYNSQTIQISLNDTDVRFLLGKTSNDISISDAYGKPTAGNSGSSYSTPGTYTFYVPGYQFLSADVRGAGSGGQGGIGCAFYPFIGCFNCSGYGAGGAGGDSSFYGMIAYGGNFSTGSGSGIGGTVTVGGGGAGGAAGSGYAFCAGSGNPGYPGGKVTNLFQKAVDGPGYGDQLSVVVGSGGAGGYNAGGTGGSGSISISWY